MTIPTATAAACQTLSVPRGSGPDKRNFAGLQKKQVPTPERRLYAALQQ
ncbi:hypothetical protein [Sandaracinobacteroides saxicola]|uniref:Uncharacterized protein n=1 Tax=Sandaracinobacteroides saxicola TaxID=2759707 RepID=A0A7G5ILR0_9SPHN|nr:hypothetical protein [Sandaracinobacteroides saxicola]QMW24302.1 hypothetical protein H3309_07575 [Sandaracinobacteroides saxicola]